MVLNIGRRHSSPLITVESLEKATTLTPDGPGRTASQMNATRRRRPRKDSSKKVHFGGNELFYGEADSHPEKLWYTRQDFRDFRAGFAKQAKAVARSNAGNRALRKAFQEFHAGQQLGTCLAREIQQYLDECEVRGLERMTGKEIYRDKKASRNRMLEKVLSVQIHCMRSKSTYSETAELLRLACEEISTPAVSFAHLIAKV